MNTGAPQGFVLSPILFSVYTSEVFTIALLTLVKFAHDMALISRLLDENKSCRILSSVRHFERMVQGMFSGSKYVKNSRLTAEKKNNHSFK